jgi:hypothetical protein
VFVQQVAEALRTEALGDVVEVGTIVVGGPDVDGFKSQAGDARAGLLDG